MVVLCEAGPGQGCSSQSVSHRHEIHCNKDQHHLSSLYMGLFQVLVVFLGLSTSRADNYPVEDLPPPGYSYPVPDYPLGNILSIFTRLNLHFSPARPGQGRQTRVGGHLAPGAGGSQT